MYNMKGRAVSRAVINNPNLSWHRKPRRQCRGKLFFIGGGGVLKTGTEGPRKFFNLESLKCNFLDFGEDLTEF